MKIPEKCEAEGCMNDAVVRGLCKSCYMKRVRAGEIDVKPKAPATCSVEGCARVHYAKGMCQGHYLDHWHAERLRRRLQLERQREVFGDIPDPLGSPNNA